MFPSSTSVTCCPVGPVSSSSVMVSVTAPGPVTPLGVVPDTVTVGFAPTTSLSTAVIVTSAVGDVAFAAKLSIVPLIVTAAPGVADTVTSNAVGRRR